MKGMSFENIAKWIGHSNPSVTSGVYGKLSQRDVNGLITGVPFIDAEEDGRNARAEWTRVARFVHRPYIFDSEEWTGLGTMGPEPDQAVPPPCKRQALQYARSIGIMPSPLPCGSLGASSDNLRALMREMIREEVNQSQAV